MSDDDTPVEWVGSSKEYLSAFPRKVKETMGFALRVAQKGGKHIDAKPLKGFRGAGVLEVIEDFDGNTYRGVYTVKMKGVIYVLHAFQKKSKSGIRTPEFEIKKIQQRLKIAEQAYVSREKEADEKQGKRRKKQR